MKKKSLKKKVTTAAMALVMMLTLLAQSALALDDPPNIASYSDSGNAGLAQCYADYIEYYLPGVSEDVRQALQGYVSEGLDAETIDSGMPLMSAFTSLRKAGQAGEEADNQAQNIAPAVDVIKEYYKLSDEQKSEFTTNFQSALTAIGLTVVISDNAVTISSGDSELAVITLVTEQPKSVTRMYLDAYIPGLSDENKTAIEALVAQYTAQGGSPAGSGAVWRIIREIGTLMGVEATSAVDMAAGSVVLTVTKEGETYFKNLEASVQDAVIAKVGEAAEGIELTYDYTDGLLTLSKNGAVSLSLQLLEAAGTSAPEPAPEVTAVTTTEPASAAPPQSAGSDVPRTGDASSLWIFVMMGASAAAIAVLSVVKKKLHAAAETK